MMFVYFEKVARRRLAHFSGRSRLRLKWFVAPAIFAGFDCLVFTNVAREVGIDRRAAAAVAAKVSTVTFVFKGSSFESTVLGQHSPAGACLSTSATLSKKKM